MNRNIDNDYNLYFHMKKYYKNEINEIQLNWILSQKKYSQKEIEQAIFDYHLVYIRNYNFLRSLFIFSLITIFLIIIHQFIDNVEFF